MTKQKFETTKQHILWKLGKELAPNLFYHGVHHTRDDVLPAAERLAKQEGIGGEDYQLLQTAALFHDAGYIKQYQKNESMGVKIALDNLPYLGYSMGQIERVGEIIMATQLQMVDGKFIQVPDPDDLLQKIMCDADLDSLGREDFFVTSENLRRELREYDMPKSLREWYEDQLNFLENHSYFTSAANSLRKEGKRNNIKELKDVLGRD